MELLPYLTYLNFYLISFKEVHWGRLPRCHQWRHHHRGSIDFIDLPTSNLAISTQSHLQIFHFSSHQWRHWRLRQRWTDFLILLPRQFLLNIFNRCQFHQHFTCSFLAQKSNAQLFCTWILAWYFLAQLEIGGKAALKMLVKLATIFVQTSVLLFVNLVLSSA